ncbi:MAG: hypothetical protein AAGC46_00355 [Solirubrobacteraceae bacterium]|nr:hypothetical protein [Patulibacter sp.]
MYGFTDDELLKFRLLADGVRVSDAARVAWQERFGGPLTLAEYATTSGVAIVLPGHLYVNAPLEDDDRLPELVVGDGGFVVRDGSRDVPIDVIPVPAVTDDLQVDGLDGTEQPNSNYGVTHTDRVRVSPIAGCAWKCHFCDLPFEFAYRKKHADNLLNTILAAERDPLSPARHVLVSGGTPRAPVKDRPGRPGTNDEAWIDGVFEHLATHSPLPVDIMLPPRKDLGHPAWLRSIGVNMLSINLEVSDPARAKVIAPAKSKVGRGHTLDYIERAVEAFGVGYVQSLVVFGEAIEPNESTLQGVRDLVDRGCVPVLSAFRPHHRTPLADAPAATFEEMASMYRRTLDICDASEFDIRPGPRCIACHHNTATLPDDSGFYIGQDDDITGGRWAKASSAPAT